MLIQTYLENAFKHAFVSPDKIHRLTIQVLKHGKQILVTVEDNGPGIRKVSTTNGTQKGMKLMEQYFKMFYKLHQTKVNQQVDTVYDDQKNINGTKVTLKIEPV